MNEYRTTSILQRLPVILAVTAASYGLQLQSQVFRLRTAAADAMSGAPAVPAVDRALRDMAPTLVTSCTALPPEGASAGLGRPGAV